MCVSLACTVPFPVARTPPEITARASGGLGGLPLERATVVVLEHEGQRAAPEEVPMASVSVEASASCRTEALAESSTSISSDVASGVT